MEVLWILLVPLIWLFVAKYLLRTTFNWKELGVSFAIVTILTAGTWQLGKYGQTQDTEIWNGYITEKKRVHDTYLESYSCNCSTSCSGSGKNRSCSTVCQTCYRKHYTVDWYADSTIGRFNFDSADRTSSSVYNLPDPERYKVCKQGEPAAREKSYTNYVQAVPQSLFHDDGDTAKKQFTDQIPAYPRVYDFHRIKRVLNVGATIPYSTQLELNDMLNNELKTLGATKQANIVLIITEIDDPSYRYAVEQAWLGAEKNDIVVFVGLDGNTITWVDVMTWALNSGNELFHVTMRDGITNMKTLEPKVLSPFIAATIKTLYDRPHMKDYEYLVDEIEPPTWVFWLAIFFAFGGSAILTFIFHKHEIN